MILLSIVKLAIGWVRVCKCNWANQILDRNWYEWHDKLLSIVGLKLIEFENVSNMEEVPIVENDEKLRENWSTLERERVRIGGEITYVKTNENWKNMNV